MRIRFTFTEPTHLDGVWRYPGETVRVNGAEGRRYVALGLAADVSSPRLGASDPHPAEPLLESASEKLVPAAVSRGAAGHSAATGERGTEGFEAGPERAARDAAAPVVSVIVPVYRNERFIGPLFSSLKECAGATTFETVVVSSGSGRLDAPGTQVILSQNIGYAHANNVGVTCASRHSKHLCLLNADCLVTPGWLDAMVRFLEEHPDVGVVGNKHLNRAGLIDSLGSEWNWHTGAYEHVGCGQRSHSDEAGPIERDMVTFACVLIRREVWDQLGGLDDGYRLGYWEDGDFCLRARRAGWRVFCVTESVVHHWGQSSGAGGHKFYAQNRALFYQRYVETGMVDKFARQRGRRVHAGDMVACYIVLNEAEYIAPSLESIYPLVDRVVIIEGGNDYAVAAGWCGADKRSTDGTVEAIKAFPDPAGKITLIQGAWKDKVEQRNAYARELKPGDWMLLMDGDEVFTDPGLWRLSYLMHRHDVIVPGFWLFWNDFQTVATGVWTQFPQVKVVKWQEGYHYRDHNCPCDASGTPVTRLVKPYRTAEPLYCHYSWVKPIAKLRAKAAYYERQPGSAERVRRNYVDDVFLAWRQAPREVELKHGTHPFGGGEAQRFAGTHPEPIQRRIESGQLGGEGW